MKKRKLQRAKKSNGKEGTGEDTIITTKAENTARAATRGEPTIDFIGNFIFFSTPSGEGWMLDHRKNYALRLAEDSSVLPYRIVEGPERFQVEWKERFRLEGDLFIAIRKGEETIFREYPVEALNGLIALIKEKRHNPPSSPPRKPH